MYFQKKKVRPTPWNAVMDIGPHIRLPVSGYRKVCLQALHFMYFYVLQSTILLLWILLHYHLFVVNESKLFYKQISPATLPSWKTISAVDKEASIDSETSYIRQDESQTVVEREEVIEGFKFGTTLVPFSGI